MPDPLRGPWLDCLHNSACLHLRTTARVPDYRVIEHREARFWSDKAAQTCQHVVFHLGGFPGTFLNDERKVDVVEPVSPTFYRDLNAHMVTTMRVGLRHIVYPKLAMIHRVYAWIGFVAHPVFSRLLPGVEGWTHPDVIEAVQVPANVPFGDLVALPVSMQTYGNHCLALRAGIAPIFEREWMQIQPLVNVVRRHRINEFNASMVDKMVFVEVGCRLAGAVHFVRDERVFRTGRAPAGRWARSSVRGRSAADAAEG